MWWRLQTRDVVGIGGGSQASVYSRIVDKYAGIGF